MSLSIPYDMFAPSPPMPHNSHLPVKREPRPESQTVPPDSKWASSSDSTTSPISSLAMATLSLTNTRNRKMLRSGQGPVWPRRALIYFAEALIIWAYTASHNAWNGRSFSRVSFIKQYLSDRGIRRERKQITSHIQVLKESWRGTRFFDLLYNEQEANQHFLSPGALPSGAHIPAPGDIAHPSVECDKWAPSPLDDSYTSILNDPFTASQSLDSVSASKTVTRIPASSHHSQCRELGLPDPSHPQITSAAPDPAVHPHALSQEVQFSGASVAGIVPAPWGCAGWSELSTPLGASVDGNYAPLRSTAPSSTRFTVDPHQILSYGDSFKFEALV